MRGQSEPQLDAATLRMEVDPQNLLEEVEAQVRIGGAWMSERGIAQRCRLARNTAEVTGALIELERQGRVISQDRDTALALWRSADAKVPAPQRETPERPPETQLRRRLPPAADHPLRGFRVVPPKEISMVKPRHEREDRSAPVLDALRAGPLTRAEVAQKTGIPISHVSDALCHLRHKGRVKRGGHRTWVLTSGAAIAPSKPSHAPPRGPSKPRVHATNGAQLRWFLGSDGSVRIEQGDAGIDLTPEQFDTLRRAHQVVLAARAAAEG